MTSAVEQNNMATKAGIGQRMSIIMDRSSTGGGKRTERHESQRVEKEEELIFIESGQANCR